jgi:hypothetical protein
MIYISDALVIGPQAATVPLNNARIGIDNITYGKTPVASSTVAGFPAIAATYPTTFEYWMPNAMPATWAIDNGTTRQCDYAGIVGEIAGRQIDVQSSDDNATWTTHASIIAGQKIAMILFPAVTARYWRLRFSGAAPRVAVVYIGLAVAMQRAIYQGHSPLTLSRVTEMQNNTSEGGQYLGRSIIRSGTATEVSFRHLSADWYRTYFDPFVKRARTMPFFFAWRPQSYPNEVGFMWTSGDIKPTNSGPRDFMSVGFEMTGMGID